MITLPIFIGSASDQVFLQKGLEHLAGERVYYEVIVSSTHRQPRETSEKIMKVLEDENIKVIIAGAATATGLPGVISGYLTDRNIIVLGVRFNAVPGPFIVEDATFNISSMPERVPMAYTGFNEKGFYHACMLAARIIKSFRK